MALSNFVLAKVMAAFLSTPLIAQAGPLNVVEVGAPAINCVFHADCKITVDDTIGPIALLSLVKPGTAWLQSRTFTGAAGTPGAGMTGYDYRVSMTEAENSPDGVAGLVLNFGKVTPLPYKDGKLADVFVVTSGGLGTIGLKLAEQFDDVIVFEFDQYVCAEGGPSIKNTTSFSDWRRQPSRCRSRHLYSRPAIRRYWKSTRGCRSMSFLHPPRRGRLNAKRLDAP